MPPQILIIGLREIGTTIGLALRQLDHPPTLFGYDLDKEAAGAALEVGAYERRVLDPRKTAREVDLVVLALPPDEPDDLFGDLVNALKPGATLLDLTPQAHSPEHASAAQDQPGRVIRGTPVLSTERLLEPDPMLTVDVDLFRGGMLGLAISPETPEAGVALALSIAEALGASPFFIDPAELEYVVTAVDLLPAMLAVMLLRSLSDAPGWVNVQKLAGRPFLDYVDHATLLREQLTDQLWGQRQSLLSQLDRLSQEIGAVQAALGAETSDQLQDLVARGLAARAEWMNTRFSGRMRSDGDTQPPRRGLLSTLFGLGPRRPPRGDRD
jgi:prephenate dehydrogenase